MKNFSFVVLRGDRVDSSRVADKLVATSHRGILFDNVRLGIRGCRNPLIVQTLSWWNKAARQRLCSREAAKEL